MASVQIKVLFSVVDCEWNQWSSWTYMECSSICYNGITDVWAHGTQQSYRRRTILRYQSGGGVCKGQNFEQQNSACKKQCSKYYNLVGFLSILSFIQITTKLEVSSHILGPAGAPGVLLSFAHFHIMLILWT